MNLLRRNQKTRKMRKREPKILEKRSVENNMWK